MNADPLTLPEPPATSDHPAFELGAGIKLDAQDLIVAEIVAVNDHTGTGRIRGHHEIFGPEHDLDIAPRRVMKLEQAKFALDPARIGVSGQEVGLAKERCDDVGVGAAVQALGGSRLNDSTIHHDGHMVGEAERLLLIVGHENRGDSGLAKDMPDFRANTLAQGGVEVGKGFIKKDHPGIRRKRPGKGDPLLLAAGQFMGQPVFDPAKSHEGKDLLDPAGRVGMTLEPVCGVGGHIKMGKQSIFLKDHANPALLGR